MSAESGLQAQKADRRETGTGQRGEIAAPASAPASQPEGQDTTPGSMVACYTHGIDYVTCRDLYMTW